MNYRYLALQLALELDVATHQELIEAATAINTFLEEGADDEEPMHIIFEPSPNFGNKSN